MKVAHEEQRDPGDAFKRAAIGFYLAHHLKLAGFFPPESDYMTDSVSESSSSNKDGFFSVKNQTVVTIVTLLVSNDEILVTGFHFFCAVLKIWAAGSCCVQGCRNRGIRGLSNILKDQVTLFQPECADYALHFTTRTLGFLDHPAALVWDVAIWVVLVPVIICNVLFVEKFTVLSLHLQNLTKV